LKKTESFDLSRSDWENLIDQWVFKERDRAMLKRRLLDGITYERLAEEFDMSTQNVCSTIYKCQDKVFKHL
jgi:hypothetical protein